VTSGDLVGNATRKSAWYRGEKSIHSDLHDGRLENPSWMTWLSDESAKKKAINRNVMKSQFESSWKNLNNVPVFGMVHGPASMLAWVALLNPLA
jgi:hypothetical protein